MIKLSPIDYTITAEGETEVWYFEHLKSLINKSAERQGQAVFEPKKCVFPYKHAKNVSPFVETWFHIMDRESIQEGDTASFETRLQSFCDVKKIKSKAKLVLGYSNVSFELWLLLHKLNNVKSVDKAKSYWKDIKRVYKLNNISQFEKYKGEDNFKRYVLSQITLDDIKNAIRNAERIEKENNEICTYTQYKKFKYCVNNPSLSIHLVVKQILEDAGLL